MASLQFDIPHSLGKAEARRRIAAGLPKLEQHIPGGGQVGSNWPTDDQLKLDIAAMGQKVGVDLLVEDAAVRCSVSLPLMLSMMSGPVVDFIKSSTQKLLAKP